ncbi:MAG: hypothetical protein AMXMBFR7_51650 [Planctomycetota bacterium]
MMQAHWEAFYRSVKIEGSPTVCSAENCALASTRLNIQLPPSYCEYVSRFGYGEWLEDLSILVPCEPHLVGSVEDFNLDCRSIIEEWVSYEGTKEPDRLKRLVGFMNKTDGFSFAWDPATKRSDGEMGIYLFQCPEVLEYCCHDLLMFLRDFWIGGRINEVYPFADGERWQTKPQFKVKQAGGR